VQSEAICNLDLATATVVSWLIGGSIGLGRGQAKHRALPDQNNRPAVFSLYRFFVGERPLLSGSAVVRSSDDYVEPWSAPSSTSITLSLDRACRKNPTNRSSFKCREIFSSALK